MSHKNKLKLIIGKPSDNISDIVFDKLLGAAASGKKTILIVPDQAEFETERRLYARCRQSGSTGLFSRIEITTISKLCDTILEQYEKGNKPADDITKSILMYCAVRDCRGELGAFRKIAEKPGFAGKMLSTVSMLKAAGYTPGEGFSDKAKALTDTLDRFDQVLSSKFQDINRIYLHYDALLGARYSDRLDGVAKAASLAKNRHFFADTEVFLQDFDTFSANQRVFIDTIISTAEKVTMAYITEQGEHARDIFLPVNNEISHFTEVADGTDHITVENIAYSDYDSAIDAVGSRIFGVKPEKPLSDLSDSITIVSADNVFTELDYVAAEIKRLCTEEGYRYNQIALLTPSPEDYKTSIENTFEKYDIPLFCDIPDSMRHMPLTNLVLALLNVVQSFTVENLLSYIKTGFVRINGTLLSDNDINHFEEFLFKWSIRPDDLKQEFPKSIGRHDSTDNAERIRKGLVDSIFSLRDSLKGCDGADMTKLICEYLLKELDLSTSISRQYMGIDQTDTALIKQLISSYQMQWNVLRQIFESLYDNLRDIHFDLKAYYQLFRDICINTPLAKPPQVLDAVIAGDVSRTKAYDIRAAFIVGAGFESFPADKKHGGIFSEYEMKLLIEDAQLPLGKNEMDNYLYSQYQAYRALTLPRERLYVSCPALDISSCEVSPSAVISDIQALCTVREENVSEKEFEFYCRSVRAAQQRYAALYREGTQDKADLQLALKIADGSYDNSAPRELNTDYTAALDKAASSRSRGYEHRLDPNIAELIFRTDTISATSMEKLNACPFSYFCEKGLKISDVTAKEVNPIEIGNAVHHALRNILESSFSSDEQYDSFINSKDERLESSARAALDDYKEKAMLGGFAKSNRFNYLYDNISVAVTDMLKIFREEFRHSKYRPKLYEVNINKENSGERINDIPVAPLAVELDNRRTIYITGIIDRVDTLTDADNNRYIRVIDYKTGEKKLNGKEIKYGLNTQMLNYLIALCITGDEFREGGICYIPSGVANAADDRESFKNRLMTKHAPKGLYVKYGEDSATENDIDSYLGGMSEAFEVSDSSKIINKDTDIISKEQFEQLKADCIQSNKNALNSIYEGSINAIPTTMDKLPCEYCNFKNVCGNSESAYNKVDIGKKTRGSAKKGGSI